MFSVIHCNVSASLIFRGNVALQAFTSRFKQMFYKCLDVYKETQSEGYRLIQCIYIHTYVPVGVSITSSL